MLSDEIREELEQELAKKDADPRKLAELSDELLAGIDGQLRFTVDAGMINRLGVELVGRQDTALGELIKNAYDADATHVEIVFAEQEKTGGTLAIRDNGVGMTEDTLRNAWMRLSTNQKVEEPRSKVFGRMRAGRKGIGRFAVQRLGKRLELHTGVKGAKEGLKVIFDWDSDFKTGGELGHVWYDIESYEKPEAEQGTILIIRDLRDPWSEALIRRVWRSVLLLQTPLTKKERKTEGKKPDQFTVEINTLAEGDKETLATIQSEFLDHSLAIIEAFASDDGTGYWSVTSEKLGVDEKVPFEHDYNVLGDVRLFAHYFIYSSQTMSGVSVKLATKMGHEFGGIRVYREGYRVLPYGEGEDDWLRLARDTARRNLLVPANNFNFFGHVEVSRDTNPLLEETSSREGLIENEAYTQLQDFARSSLEAAALRIAEVREVKRTASQKGFTSKNKKTVTETLEAIIDEIKEKSVVVEGHTHTDIDFENEDEALSGDPGPKDGFVDGEREALIEKLSEALSVAQQSEEEREEHIKYESMLRVLASLGISIAIFGHEIQGAHTNAQTEVTRLRLKLKKLSETEQSSLIEHTNGITEAIDRLHELGRYVSLITSKTESREMRSVSLHRVVTEFIENFGLYMNGQGIQFAVEIPDEIYTCRVHRSELDSVLFNFLTNSVKSLQQAASTSKLIKVDASQKNKMLSLVFQDNGIGIHKDIEHRLFNAFFTTTKPETKGLSSKGTGLGLKIVADIADSYGGSVQVIPPSPGYSAAFEFKIPTRESAASA